MITHIQRDPVKEILHHSVAISCLCKVIVVNRIVRWIDVVYVSNIGGPRRVNPLYIRDYYTVLYRPSPTSLTITPTTNETHPEMAIIGGRTIVLAITSLDFT